jgi:hypothetical protein
MCSASGAHLLAGEAAGGVARHLRHVTVDEAVVGAARADDLAPDVAEAGLVLRGAHRRGPPAIRASAREPLRQLEVVAVALDQGEEARRGLGDEGLRHALRQVVGRSCCPPLLRVARDRRRRGAFRRRIREALGIHLVVVDGLARLRAAAPGLQRLVQDGAGSGENGVGRVRHRRAI